MRLRVSVAVPVLLVLWDYTALRCAASGPLLTDEELERYSKISQLLDDVSVGYDKRLPPNYGKGKCLSGDPDGLDRRCVEVLINIMIRSMSAISEIDMDYSMTMFIRERWTDKRLAFNNTMNLTRLEMDWSFMDRIWKPDVFIVNEKMSEIHEVTVPNQLVHIYPNGTVQISMRVTGTFTCNMNLLKYPFDTQECYLELESYAHSTEQLQFRWSDDAVTVAKGITFPQFTLTDTVKYGCNKIYFGIEYPCVGIRFVLERQYSYYIIQIYVPSVLIVVLSWVSFWLDADAVPARISIGLLTVLTMETQSSSARATLPPVSNVKAIDVWMAVCLAFVFLALIEFAYVNVQSRVHSRRRRREDICIGALMEKTLQIDTSSQAQLNDGEKKNVNCFDKMYSMGRARCVDKTSRIVFPLTFLLFNIGYWIFYFMWKPETV